MRKNLQVLFSIALLPVIFIFSSCTKETDEDLAPETPDTLVAQYVNGMNVDSIRKYVQWMQNYGTRFFLAENRSEIATGLKNKFIQLGYINTRIDSFYLTASWNNNSYNTWQYNVIARLEGSETPGRIYVTGAHYDCIVDEGTPFTYAPGANDNASGVAGTLEIARVLKLKGFVPKSTIEFVAFASEENDLDGSGDYAAKARAANTNIIMMLNNDMIAYSPGISESSGRKVTIMDYSNSNDLRTLFVKCGETYTNLVFNHDNTYSEDGDSYSFFNEGYKSLFVISDQEDAYYHTINDIAGRYNYYYCRDVASVTCALLVQENK